MLTLNNVEETENPINTPSDGNSAGLKTKVKKFDLFDLELKSKVRSDFRFNEEELEITYSKAGRESPEIALRKMSIALDSSGSNREIKSKSGKKKTLSKMGSLSPRKSRFAGNKSDAGSDNSLDYNPYSINNNPRKISKFASVQEAAPKKKAKKKEEAEEEDLCIICYTYPQNSVCMPCGHGSTCIKCANTFVSDTGKCSICREKVIQVIEIENGKSVNGCFKVKKVFIFVDEEEPESGNKQN